MSAQLREPGGGQMNVNELEFHELANEFPLLEGEELDDLAKDIKNNGLREQIVLLDDKILDGRNRYNACKQIGYEFKQDDFVPLDPEKDDPVLFVIAKNIRRRHLSPGQRAALVHEFEKRLKAAERERKKTRQYTGSLSDGTDSRIPTFAHCDVNSREERAAAAGVSVDAVKEAGYVEKHAPEEYKKIKAGRKSLHKAAKEAAKKQAGQQHDEALARIREVCGKDFAQAVDGAQVIALKQPKKAIAFAGLSDDHMKQLAPVLGMGWQYNRAIGFLGKEVTPAM